MSQVKPPLFRLGLIAALLAVPLPAQIPIGGAQSGTLPAGVYHTTSTLVVATATTWTLNPGVIIKFTSSGHRLAVDGTLNANGTAGNPVIFTDDADDSAGGDTNANGASGGSPTAWEGVVFNPGSGGLLNYTDIRYGGSSFVSNVELNSASPTLTNCTIRNCFTDGMDLNTNSSPTVTNCTFTNNSGYAIQRVAMGAIPGITNNTATGNSTNSLHVTSGTLASNLSIGPASNLSGGILLGVSLVVPAGMTFTVGAGTNLKFDNNGIELTVNGTLQSNGTSGNPVIFTDDADDSAGGDTNSNGASGGSAAAWRGVVFNFGSSASALTHTHVRYGGSSFVSNIELNSSSPTLTNCTIASCFTDGMDLNGVASPNGLSLPTVTNCTFVNNSGYAIQRAHIQAVSGITNNSASGNSVNSIHVTDATLGANVAIGPTSNLSGGVLVGTSIVIPPGATLTLTAGTILKLDNNGVEITVNGTIVANGASGNPVIFTDDADDSAGGDTNSNGASGGSPIAWRGMVFNATSTACSLNFADVRYGGSAFVSNIELNSASPTLTNCTIRNCHTDGMDLNTNSNPTVTNCTFTGNGGYAIQRVHIGAVAGLTNNAASLNAVNSVHVTGGTVAGSASILAASNLSGGILVGTSLSVPSGATLTLGAGVILKLDNNSVEITVDGNLQTNGGLASPVILTAAADDTAGGDTDNNGPTSGSPTAWRGLVFNPGSDASSLTYTHIRFGGASFVSNVELNAANPTLSRCTIQSCHTGGMDLNGNSSPTVEDCSFVSNTGPAVQNAALSGISGFTNNTASGNGGNYIRVTNGAVSSAVTIGAQSILNGALWIATTVNVQPAGVLNLGPGVVFKFETNSGEVVVDGAAHFRGTAYEPVVLTGGADDSWGGDTNNNGPSSGGPTAWRGVTFNAGALTSSLENVMIRYTGSAFIPGLTSGSPNLSLRSVRVDSAYDRGFVLGALAANPVNLVAWGCGGNGIHLTGGSFTVSHATCASNAAGIRAEAGWSGSVINSNVWGNGTNFANFGAGGAVSFSNGAFSGSNNDINVDPLFVSQATGDLHLQPASPCLNAADLFPAFAVLKDWDENSRILDSALTGVPGADMGAYELGAWDMNVFGAPRIGTTLTFVVNGPAGNSIYALGILDGFYPYPPYGILLAGASPFVSVIELVPGLVPVNTSVSIPLPYDPSLLGLTAGIQTLTYGSPDPTKGNFTQLYRATVRR